MLLGYLPRVTVKHTAYHTEGQIYIPEVNNMLAIGCIMLVLTFRESVKLAAAYGIAVTGNDGDHLDPLLHRGAAHLGLEPAEGRLDSRPLPPL